jgi:uncharacterized circularly permuted ATP-grasp superfamily protein/uncharacterized alpha-E superfamily protein
LNSSPNFDLSVQTHARPWHEILDPRGRARKQYQPLLDHLERYYSPADLKELEERLEATLRELGISFEGSSSNQLNTWFSDLLPQVFLPDEWELLKKGFEQRIRAFELFLQDVYGQREILRQGALPIPIVLGSPHFHRSAVGLRPPQGSYLHLSGLAICRDPQGHLTVKNHYFGHASGLSYMVQNRRLLARVIPDLFEHHPVESVAQLPTEILMGLRAMSNLADPAVVLLTPGVASAVYSEHSFLARRLGIPLVLGEDLLVLDGSIFLKTVSGLERVDVVYSRVADPWLDPLIFNTDSRLGVPGLVHCLRKGTVTLVNAVGSQLADDRSLLHFASAIIRFYLGEWPILPTLTTYWLGDLDQREMVLENLDSFQIRYLTGERFLSLHQSEKGALEIENEVRKAPHLYVAQPIDDTARTLCSVKGKLVERLQDHIVYGMRDGTGFNVFPGALTRLSSSAKGRTESEHGGGGKDTWVISAHPTAPAVAPSFRRPWILPTRQVTSRVAEGFYWLGRYLERALHVSKMIQYIETIEMEELTPAERKLYRPIWNQLLPPLETSGRRGRRGINSVKERYYLMLDPDQAGSVTTMIRRGLANASSLREVISPEAWSVLSLLRGQFQRRRFQQEPPEAESRRTTRRISDAVLAYVPQFFATAQQTMLADDGWRFCELGMYVERAITTANAAFSVASSVRRAHEARPALDIELSVFLRLLGCRDAYRRIYQTRSEPAPVLEFLWQNPAMPRSVMYALEHCTTLLSASLPKNSAQASVALNFLQDLVRQIRRLDWYSFFLESEESPGRVLQADELVALTNRLFDEIEQVHYVIADNFLTHQSIISEPEPTLFG